MKKIKSIFIIAILLICVFAPSLVSRFSMFYTRTAGEIGKAVFMKYATNITRDTTYSQFDNTNVIGSQVNLATQLFYKDGTIISVKTLGDSAYKNYTKTKPYNIKDPKDVSYIISLSKFKSTILKDSKGNAIEIKFTEVK